MHNYQMIEKIGEGGYGKVYKLRKVTEPEGKFYAGKILKSTISGDGISGTTIREIMLMKLLPPHLNIVRLEEFYPYENTIVLIFEYAKTDLFKVLHDPKYANERMPLDEIKRVFYQTMAGLAHLHKNNIIHRDIKPENVLLVGPDKTPKLCDFGLARDYNVPIRQLSSKAVTLWYRPPELLWGSVEYSTAVDMWSMGCLLVQMFIGTPLFPVRGEEEDRMRKEIFKICGTPTQETWPGFFSLPRAQRDPLNYKIGKTDMHKVFMDKGCKENVIKDSKLFDLIDKLLQLNPELRITAADALADPWFKTTD